MFVVVFLINFDEEFVMVSLKIKRSLFALGLVSVPGIALATVVGSKHDLSTSNTPGVGGTEEVCVFCHTPHGSDTSAPAPLWNKVLPTAASFTTYDALGTATLDGQINLTEGGISLACLSCHDGTTAMDLVLNAPTVTQGVYRYDVNGANLSSGVTMASLAPAPVPVLEKDLRNDHPVGVQYAGGGLNWAPIQAGNNVLDSANDKQFVDPIWDNNRLWIGDVGTPNGVIGDEGLPLYKGATLGPMVECATCHNPHKTDNGSFLRRSNAASALCRACHLK